jgi:protein-L-isoaspartate(D-aspartate) O-methyltransferase
MRWAILAILAWEGIVIPDWRAERIAMVENQLRRRGIRSERVLEAIAKIPREDFVPPEHRVLSYSDEPIHIGFGQTISQPYMTAVMAEALDLRGDETVLDIGAGSGFHAAVLGSLARRVVSVELIPALTQLARENLARAGLGDNVLVITGDGSRGYPESAPYDAISVAAGAPEIPPMLLEQLADPGRLVIPIGSRDDQELRLVVKRGGRLEYRTITFCRFVPLRGEQGWE